MFFRRWWLPGWLYEPLPYVSMIVGVLALEVLEGALGAFAGAVLLLVGITIWILRWSYRRNALVGKRARPAVDRVRIDSGEARSYYND